MGGGQEHVQEAANKWSASVVRIKKFVVFVDVWGSLAGNIGVVFLVMGEMEGC